MTRRSLHLIIGSVTSLLIICSIAAGTFYYLLTRAGPDTAPQTVIITRGAGPGQIATVLEDQGLIVDKRVFKLASRLLRVDRGLRAGEFAIPPKASIREILNELRHGAPVLRRVTVAEGLSSADIVTLLAATDGLAGTVTSIPDEGSLLPETYYFSYGDSREGLLQRMRQSQKDILARLWDDRADDLPLMDIKEAIILASIVEKETGLAEERPLVASVFINRLKNGMRLQSDPTIIYGIGGGVPLGRPIRKSELAQETPFNTYKIDGLPPTPIANPGIDAIKAVLNPPQTDYFYFVADGSGGHAFARTLAEHNRNVARWRALNRE